MEGTLTVKVADGASGTTTAVTGPGSRRAGSGPTCSPLAHSSTVSSGSGASIATARAAAHRHQRVVDVGAVEHRRERAQEIDARHGADHAHVEERRRQRGVGRDHHPARVAARCSDRDQPRVGLEHVVVDGDAHGRRPVRRQRAERGEHVERRAARPVDRRSPSVGASASKPALATVVDHVACRRRSRPVQRSTRSTRPVRRSVGGGAGSPRGISRWRAKSFPEPSGHDARTPPCSAASPANGTPGRRRRTRRPRGGRRTRRWRSAWRRRGRPTPRCRTSASTSAERVARRVEVVYVRDRGRRPG